MWADSDEDNQLLTQVSAEEETKFDMTEDQEKDNSRRGEKRTMQMDYFRAKPQRKSSQACGDVAPCYPSENANPVLSGSLEETFSFPVERDVFDFVISDGLPNQNISSPDFAVGHAQHQRKLIQIH